MSVTPEHGRQPRNQPGATAAPPLLSVPDGTDVRDVDLALEGIEVGIFEWDAASGAYCFSERCRSIWCFGIYDPMTPELMLRRVHPADRRAALRMLAGAVSGATQRYSLELRIVPPGGAVRWVQIAARTERAADGGLRGYGAMRDNTERRLAEQKLHERSLQLRAFVETIPAPIAILDRSLRYVAASRRYAEERGHSVEDLVGNRLDEVFPGVPQLWHNRYQRALEGATLRGESESLPWLRPGDRCDWLRWEMRPWYKSSSQIGGIIVFAEFMRRSPGEQELHDSQARLELAIHAGELGVFDYDFASQHATWNERLGRLFGFSPEQAISIEQMKQRFHPEDWEKFTKDLRAAAAAGPGSNFKAEYRIIPGAAGPLRWLAFIGRMTDEDGRFRVVGVVKEVTRRKETELALERSAAELRRVDERKNLYLATLSHELRTPLAPIRTAAHLLASPQLAAEQLQWVAEVIGRQTAHMASLLDDLLEITRISRGKLVLRKTQVALPEITQPALDTVRPQIDAKGHHLLVSLPEVPLTVYADPLRMSQVLSNILANAAKYTDPGGQIELIAAVEDEDLVMRVRDNGIGIPRESLGKIFSMFWQDGPPSSHGGLGIGLAFAEAIVQLHGGTLEARSEGLGRGTEIIVRLPRAGQQGGH